MTKVVKTNKAPGAIGPYSQGIDIGLLESQNLTFKNVVKTTVFLDNINDFATMNGIYAEYFEEPYPARSAVEVAKLPKGALLEVEVVAVK